MCLFSSLLAKSIRGFFHIPCEVLGKIFYVKLRKLLGFPGQALTWSFHISEIAILSLQEFINYSSGSLTLTLVLVVYASKM